MARKTAPRSGKKSIQEAEPAKEENKSATPVQNAPKKSIKILLSSPRRAPAAPQAPKGRRTASKDLKLPKFTSKPAAKAKKAAREKTEAVATKQRIAGQAPQSESVLCREGEYNAISTRINAFLSSSVGQVIYITGVPGSGKTHTVKKILADVSAPLAYVNCSTIGPKSNIYSRIARGLSCCDNASLQGLRAHFHSCPEKHLVFIDEVDFLYTKNEMHLYNLFELPFIENSRLLLIVISNTLNALSTKIESRIGKDRIEFKPYAAADLQHILEHMQKEPSPADGAKPRPSRLRSGIKDQKQQEHEEQAARSAAVGSKPMELICKRVAASTGDIRKAIELSRRAGGQDLRQTDAIIKEMNAPLLDKFVRALGYYQKLLLFVNLRSAPANLLEWFRNFKSHCRAKGISELDFMAFRACADELSRLGLIQLSSIQITRMHYPEEFERAMGGDPVFSNF
ncbi:origin recognition complex subunit 1 [Pancytospora philotis]|nr:origin recognition complex subunit 1 [Pancytospora philotis]